MASRDLFGTGREFDPERAKTTAVAEAAERYAASLVSMDELVFASAHELGSDAIALDQLPQCSARELADPQCPVDPIEDNIRLWWTGAVNLVTGQLILVPAETIYLGFPRDEKRRPIQLTNSTGCAVHESLEEAVMVGLCEVVERDLVSLAWLQRMRLPPLERSCLTDAAQDLVAWNDKTFVHTYLFDATGDLGLPTVYCLEHAPHAPRAAHIVGCATALDPGMAAEKALRETVTIRPVLSQEHRIPSDPREFREPFESAVFMGSPTRTGAFDFLATSHKALKHSSPSAIGAGLGPVDQLDLVLDRLCAAGVTPLAVDLATDELIRAGLHAVKVVIPELQPLSFSPLVQYRSHARLYEGPPRMGHPVYSEDRLNAWPQPFA